MPLLIAAGVALVVVLFVFGYLHEKKRREALAALAARHGWTCTSRDDRWGDAFDGSPFGLGHNRQARNVLTGTHDGRPFVGFDYVYYTTETSTDSDGRTSRREVAHWYSVLGLRIGADVPRLSVAPEGFFGRTVGRLFGNDIELESEAFNRAFTVTSDDRKFAFDILHPRLMEYLLGVRDVAWRTTNGHILTIRSGRHKPEEIEGRVEVLDRILDAVPDFVRQQYGMPGVQELR
jgi:Protein of unknown function (DUF3137)